MSINRDFWLKPFPKNHFPNWPCPKCEIGMLRPLDKTFAFEESGQITIEKSLLNGYLDYDVYDFRYSVILKCNNLDCQERVSSCGLGYVRVDIPFTTDGKMLLDEDSVPEEELIEVFIPEYFFPSIDLFPISKKCPETVINEIKLSFKLFFADPPASANYIRKAIDAILTDRGVNRYSISAKRKRIPINLHNRIVEFEKKNSKVASQLLAIKWLGNEGSHTNKITKNDVLDAYEILELVLDNLYIGHRKSVEEKVARINKNKKPLHPST